MKRIVATIAAAAALLVPATASAAQAAATLLPATPAAALDGPPAGTRSCGPMHYGFVVWVVNPKTGEPKDLVTYCQPIGPPPNAPGTTT